MIKNLESKPYFAKYLPVEGEIKEGDKFFDYSIYKEGRLRTCYTKPSKEINSGGECKKVKFLLCSRDIKVGDKVHFINAHEMTFEWNEMHEEGYLKERYYRVIGEISPEATWVKEGDEFDEDDWRYVANIWDGAANNAILNKNHAPFPDPYYVQIKGPCGHFH